MVMAGFRGLFLAGVTAVDTFSPGLVAGTFVFGEGPGVGIGIGLTQGNEAKPKKNPPWSTELFHGVLASGYPGACQGWPLRTL